MRMGLLTVRLAPDISGSDMRIDITWHAKRPCSLGQVAHLRLGHALSLGAIHERGHGQALKLLLVALKNECGCYTAC